jgi:hypothetical protein
VAPNENGKAGTFNPFGSFDYLYFIGGAFTTISLARGGFHFRESGTISVGLVYFL